MVLQKVALSLVATAAAAFVLTPALRADAHVALADFGVSVGTPDAGFGFWIGPSAPHRYYYPGPPHREYGPPWRHRYVRIVRPPVVVTPVPPTIVAPVPPAVRSSITVWITNSNASQTAVQLTPQGRGYIGPRGEYYDQMPTNEQLRLAYGF